MAFHTPLLPDQTGHSGAFLTTNGVLPSWATVLDTALSIGNSVGASATHAVLYVDGANKLADSGRFLFEDSINLLNVNGGVFSTGTDTIFNSGGAPGFLSTNADHLPVSPKDEGTIRYNNTTKHWENSVSLGAYRQFISLKTGGHNMDVPYFGTDGDLISASTMIWTGHGLELTGTSGSGGLPTFHVLSHMAEDIFDVQDRGGVTINNYSTGRVGLTITDQTGGLQPILKLVDGTEGLNKVWTSDAVGSGSWQTLGAVTFPGALDTTQIAFGTATNTIGGSSDLTWDGTTYYINGDLNAVGSVAFDSLSGVGTRLVTADASGVLSATLIPPAAIVSQANYDAQTIAISNTIFTTPNDAVAHTYRISAYLNINAVLTDAIEQHILYTDKNGNSETIKMFPIGSTTSVLSAAQDYSMQTTTFRSQANATITFASVLTTGGGTINYDMGYTLEQLD